MLVDNLRPTLVARIFFPHALGLMVWSILATAFHMASHHPKWIGLGQSFLSRGAELAHWGPVGIPFGAVGALGGALAIFLGFRNNSAYDRWWEARKIWGALVNDSRTWCRQVVAWTEAPREASEPGEEIATFKRELVHRHLAFVHGLAMHLRKQDTLQAKVAEFVSPTEAAHYQQMPNVPTALLLEQGRRVAHGRASGQLEHFRHLAMDEILTRFSDSQGKCERIKNTPIPRQYDAFPRWFVYVYCGLLPLSLAPLIGWGAVVVGPIIGLLFIALELSGRSIENPFENLMMDTPMTALAVTIERDLRAALHEPLPEPTRPDGRGILK